ncbi:iron complex outermembrane receptor protein [Pseudoduganella lurida]|uniref:Iron complex outermembrane receptor protein n=1 Tax=Pseudoduganella lurida TaxID=1036180 RepID=A0A562RKA9_9BURK|nr:secretin and TonB N-terminal domain-containing protein [Pseudoduganella lurida]TWI69488.1 iron complex outermembrane receptor protein [Pseudoduganella lurida]
MTSPTLIGALCALAVSGALHAQTAAINIPPGDLKTALDQYAAQTGTQLLYKAEDVQGRASGGAQGAANAEAALQAVLAGTGLSVRRDGANGVLVFREARATAPVAADTELATVTVTAQKRSQSAQAVPIAMTALSAKTLDVHRVQGLQDVARLTPGLLVSAFSQANPTIAIRGISNTFRRSASTSRWAFLWTTSTFPATARPASSCSTWNRSPC